MLSPDILKSLPKIGSGWGWGEVVPVKCANCDKDLNALEFIVNNESELDIIICIDCISDIKRQIKELEEKETPPNALPNR